MKYPKTPYFTFSESKCTDDIRESGFFNIENFLNKRLIVTIKMDGSNCVWTHDYIAARNGKQANGTSFDYAKQLHSAIRDRIPEHLYIYGEWLYAKHSIFYEKDLSLDGYFQVFGIYDIDTMRWSAWRDAIYYSAVINAINVPAIRIIESTQNVKHLTEMITEIAKRIIATGHEGIVVRNIDSFDGSKFSENVAKYVRANHVQTNKHWSKQKVVINKIK